MDFKEALKCHLQTHGKKYVLGAGGVVVVKVSVMFGATGVVVVLTIATLLTDIDWEKL